MSIDHGPAFWKPIHRSAARVLVALVVGLGGHTIPLHAQDPPPGESRAARLQQLACAEAEQMLAEADDPTNYLEGLTAMTRCPERGAALLARRWRHVPPDITDGRSPLVKSTMVVRDERIFATMLDLIADRHVPRQVRLAALTVAVNYADSSLVIWFEPDEMIGPFPGRSEVPWTRFSHGPTDLGAYGPRRPGPRPVVSDPLERLNAVLDVIENRPGEDEYVLGAARALFAWYEPFWRLSYNTRARSGG